MNIPALGSTVKVRTATIFNDVGGTNMLPIGEYEVRISDFKIDDETGLIAKGKLTNPKDLELARETGTSGFSPEHYLKYSNPKLYLGAKLAADKFDPSIVYISEWDIL
jgi:hypothetical protein